MDFDRTTLRWALRGGFALTLALLAPIARASDGAPRDGRLFDSGVTRSEPAETAPSDLALAMTSLGDWEIETEVHRGEEVLVSTGRSRITFMNRGHGYMERTRTADFDGEGHSLATIAFLAVNPQGVWTLSEGDSWTESISVASGGLDESGLVLYNALRPGGGATLVQLRRSYEGLQSDRFTMRLDASTDGGSTWTTRVVRRYTRAPAGGEDFFPTRDDIGLPAPDRPEAAAEFDFLLGEFDASHWLNFGGNEARWVSNATAVHALDGHAILEFDWHDADPSLPDAATTILRLYNRSMRRWESLFLPNRTHTPLHFGGVREDDRIVLHPFAMQTASNPLSQWIFHDAREDAYRWKGLRSSDRGASWTVTWGIDFQRKGTEPSDIGVPIEVATTAADGVRIFGDHYRPTQSAATTVLLFHQAGGDARGEYGAIAERLVAEGFEVMAWDARSGGERFEGTNRTVAELGESIEGYCPAYPDLEAALEYAFLHGSGGPIYAVGSSYSAALVIRLAAEHGDLLAGVAPFSPAGGRMDECAVDTWLPRVEGVAVAPFRPASEMEVESVQAQAALFEEHGLDLFVSEGGVHGASMLDASRAKGDVEPVWEQLLSFLGAS